MNPFEGYANDAPISTNGNCRMKEIKSSQSSFLKFMMF